MPSWGTSSTWPQISTSGCYHLLSTGMLVSVSKPSLMVPGMVREKVVVSQGLSLGGKSCLSVCSTNICECVTNYYSSLGIFQSFTILPLPTVSSPTSVKGPLSGRKLSCMLLLTCTSSWCSSLWMGKPGLCYPTPAET